MLHDESCMATAVRTDAEIQRDVLEELKWDARVQPNEIGVIVKDGIVTLTGWVDYLARGIAEAHGGTLTGESQVGKGSSFRVALPLSTAGQAACA